MGLCFTGNKFIYLCAQGRSQLRGQNIIDKWSKAERVFFPELVLKKSTKKRYGSLKQIQYKSISEKERKRKDRASRKEKQFTTGEEVSELSGMSLSESDLINHKETLLKRAKRTLALGKRLGVDNEGNEEGALNELNHVSVLAAIIYLPKTLWYPPIAGWLKFNIGAAVVGHKVGCGGVLRDESGTFRALFSEPVEGANVNASRVLAIFHALELFCKTSWVGKFGLLVELDSRVVLN
ncbi:hypothetical protein V6N11_047986 [Hibiscus sabdariffa]|uniref:RNase H type-1 domain-containing protein n=1 Tax=Hibiscus sabdariffa TaxID=183260 RepID=A0ABR2NXJ5_9ROSI